VGVHWTDTAQKGEELPNRQFSDEVQMADKCMEKHSTSLAIKEKQLQISLSFHLIPVIMAITKKAKNSN
jgi:hypothetical protein